MATVTRATGLGHATDVLYSTLQLKVFKIVTDNEETALTGGIGGLIERLAQEFGTTAALLEADSETVIFIGDGHALDINTVASRAGNVLYGDGVLTGAGTTAKVTVTAPTSLFGM